MIQKTEEKTIALFNCLLFSVPKTLKQIINEFLVLTNLDSVKEVPQAIVEINLNLSTHFKGCLLRPIDKHTQTQISYDEL